MQKKLAIAVVVGVVCAGCGGFSVGGVAGGGVLFFRNNGAGALLHRMPSAGGTITDVPGTSAAFVGSMDQNGDVYTTLADGNISKLVNGVVFTLTSSTEDFRP